MSVPHRVVAGKFMLRLHLAVELMRFYGLLDHNPRTASSTRRASET